MPAAIDLTRDEVRMLEHFGDRILQRRHALNLTQFDLADRINTSGRAISYWENGQRAPSVVLAFRIATALGCTVDYLLTGKAD
jgi:transcriptional regulator with XRE-family HTH domain